MVFQRTLAYALDAPVTHQYGMGTFLTISMRAISSVPSIGFAPASSLPVASTCVRAKKASKQPLV
ncbi:hypothetical protein [Ralstonia soli]|uniref:Uncharacterized protein n=1 Tax=Ralstonia soli TaxID=2953896 RepID=A0ABT1AJC6_9RALS|nr:hypothetical protein [Ralstonia soli]MCO5398518.1 hypothetical protein [Ralstonia soli]